MEARRKILASKKFVKICQKGSKTSGWGLPLKLSMLISSEMSSLEAWQFCFRCYTGFSYLHTPNSQSETWVGTVPPPHPPQLRWPVSSSMKLVWTENDCDRVWSMFYFTAAPSTKRQTFCRTGDHNNGQKLDRKYFSSALHLIIYVIVSRHPRKQVFFISQAGNQRCRDCSQGFFFPHY